MSDQEIYKTAKREIFDRVKDIPSLTTKQLNTELVSLMNREVPNVDREWKVQAVVRLLQHKYYKDHKIEIPSVIQENFDSFFKNDAPTSKKRKAPKKKDVIDRRVLDAERIRLLHSITLTCSKIVPDGSITLHPNNKYGTVKSGKNVVMFIERKLRKIIAFMGGERERKNRPKLDISIGVDDTKIKSALVEFINKHLKDFSNIRDKRWKKCEFVLKETIKAFKENLEGFSSVHAHPTGRYTTFKKGRLVLVFITQDRAKGEVSFHPGGEREVNPDLTTTIDVLKIKEPSSVESYVKKFINTHFTNYMNAKDINTSNNRKEMRCIIDICKKAVTYDETFHHPKDFFGLIKNKKRPILMIKRSGKEGCYDVVAWVKKQKNNPSITIKVGNSEKSIIKKVSELVSKYLNLEED